MSPTPLTGVVDATVRPRRRRGLRALAFTGVLGGALVLAGCQVSNTPTGYVTPEQGTIVQTNYLAACTGNLPSESSTTTVLAPMSRCECSYKVYETNVPFNDADRPNKPNYPQDAPTFEALENDMRTDPGAFNKLPQNIKDLLNSNCSGAEQTVGTTAG